MRGEGSGLRVQGRDPPSKVKSVPRALGGVPVGGILIFRASRVALDGAVAHTCHAYTEHPRQVQVSGPTPYTPKP